MHKSGLVDEPSVPVSERDANGCRRIMTAIGVVVLVMTTTLIFGAAMASYYARSRLFEVELPSHDIVDPTVHIAVEIPPTGRVQISVQRHCFTVSAVANESLVLCNHDGVQMSLRRFTLGNSHREARFVAYRRMPANAVASQREDHDLITASPLWDTLPELSLATARDIAVDPKWPAVRHLHQLAAAHRVITRKSFVSPDQVRDAKAAYARNSRPRRFQAEEVGDTHSSDNASDCASVAVCGNLTFGNTTEATEVCGNVTVCSHTTALFPDVTQCAGLSLCPSNDTEQCANVSLCGTLSTCVDNTSALCTNLTLTDNATAYCEEVNSTAPCSKSTMLCTDVQLCDNATVLCGNLTVCDAQDTTRDTYAACGNSCLGMCGPGYNESAGGECDCWPWVCTVWEDSGFFPSVDWHQSCHCNLGCYLHDLGTSCELDRYVESDWPEWMKEIVRGLTLVGIGALTPIGIAATLQTSGRNWCDPCPTRSDWPTGRNPY